MPTYWSCSSSNTVEITVSSAATSSNNYILAWGYDGWTNAIWNDCNTSGSAITTKWSSAQPQWRESTPEERAASEAAAERARLDREATEQRAAALLRSLLSEEQHAQYAKDGHIDLVVEGGERPARHYRVKRGTAGNIERLEGKKVVESWCVHPREGLPTDDVVAAQVLHLLHDDEDLRKRANVTRRSA